MPYYCYTNRETGETIRKFMSISEMLKYASEGMSIEGVWYERDITAEHSRQANRGANSGWPLKSDAAGVHPADAAKAEKASANIGVPTEYDRKTGQAIFRDRNHRRRFLKANGMHDKNGGYGDG
mgnify:CR=1 FL=1|tara:strand:- start:4938 stop:5309 length:372 start_codon:yes stop_codon:yes gene_type:complete